MHWMYEQLDKIDIESVKQTVENKLKKTLHWIYSENTQSTNDDLLALAQADSVAITEYQTQGRGQGEHIWQAEPSQHLLFSMSLDVQVDDYVGLIPIVTGLAICDVLNKLSTQTIALKWPNDVYVQRKKLAGILVEASTRNQNMRLVIGVGVNFYSSEYFDIERACLSELISPELKRSTIMAELIVSIYRKIVALKAEKIVKQFNEKHLFHGQHIQFNVDNLSVHGVCVGINEQGELIIQLEDGDIAVFSKGSISID